MRNRGRYSSSPGCLVPLTKLRCLQMSDAGFDGRARTGEMVVHEDFADECPRSSSSCTGEPVPEGDYEGTRTETVALITPTLTHCDVPVFALPPHKETP